jgi:hypothetical protein
MEKRIKKLASEFERNFSEKEIKELTKDITQIQILFFNLNKTNQG